MSRKQPTACLQCSNLFIYKKSRSQKFCNKACYVLYQRLNDYPGRFKLGHKGLAESSNPSWKGDEAGYTALHSWVSRKLGRPKLCAACGTTNSPKFEWANVSGNYLRDLADWERLCRACHFAKDNKRERVGRKWAKIIG
jgi:hypothetical protein